MTQEYKLEGLCCPNCAMKIERRMEEMNDFKEVSLNFATQTLTLEADNKHHNFSELIQGEVDKIEGGVTVSRKGKDHIHHHIDEAIHEHDHLQGQIHEHDHSHGSEVGLGTWFRLGVGAVLFIMGIVVELPDTIALGIYLTGYLIIGGDVLLRAGRNILRGQIFDENFLMSVATIGALAIKEYPEAVAVMLFYQIGELFQDMAVKRSRDSIASLMDIRPDTAWVKDGENLIQVSAEGISVGSHIFVKPGERIPLDGEVVNGESMLDTSALTGEAVPRKASPEDIVLSGSVNQTGMLEIKVTKHFGDSTVSRILELVEKATNKKAETEKFITKFARYYTPAVVYTALALAIIPPLLISGASFSDWLHRALIFLVVSCPCALVISIPLGFFGGIGGASGRGVLIKGSNYLEALKSVDTVVFDKTGTLTKGVFKVMKTVSHSAISENDLLEVAAMVESQSNHPIAKSILQAYGESITLDAVSELTEYSGKGLSGYVSDQKIYAGNGKLMADINITVPRIDEYGTVIHVAEQNSDDVVTYLGYLLISDEIKADSKEAIVQLKENGIKKVVMLTGDHKTVADHVAGELGIDEVHSDLLPHEKVEILENILDDSGKRKTIFVGDGINDAPVLARADVGVAMGGVGSDAAIEAADVVLMTDEPSKLVDALKVAVRTRNIVWQNIIFAMAVKGIVLILGAGGIATMWEAVFADVGVALIAIVNAMRIIRKPVV